MRSFKNRYFLYLKNLKVCFVNLIMTTITVNIPDDKDLSILQEILNRFGLNYTVDTGKEYDFTEDEIKSLLKTNDRKKLG
jgi:hypothetical protein